MNLHKDIWNEIIKHDSIVILTHKNPDGDTIGSAIALKNLITENTNIKDVFISGAPYPRNLQFLESNDVVSDEVFNKSQIIVVDTASISRIFDQRVITKEAILIDHHHEEGEWLLGFSGDNYPATGQIIYELAKANNLKINQNAADGIFVAIWTDTEGMSERMPTKDTEVALKGVSANKENILKELEPTKEEQLMINKLVRGLKQEDNFAYVLLEEYIPNDIVKPAVAEVVKVNPKEITLAMYLNEKGGYRVSLRSKGNIDISKIAKHFGGGGHLSSAGAEVSTKEEALSVIDYLRKI